MPYKIAGIDVHKRMLHVVVSDVEVDGEYDFTRRIFGCAPEKPQEGLILGRSGGSRTETVRKPASLASQRVSSLGEPASRRRSPFYCGSGDGPDELSSFYFVVGR